MLYRLGVAPCTNLRELVFGPVFQVRGTFERSRKQLARFPSDSAIIDLIEQAPERMNARALGLPVNPMYRIAGMIGAAVGNKRLRGCVGMLDVYGNF